MEINGIILRNAVKRSGLTAAETALKSGIPKRTLFHLYHADRVEQHYIDRLKKIGIEFETGLGNSANSAISMRPGGGPNEELLKDMVTTLKESIRLYQSVIETMEGKERDLKKIIADQEETIRSLKDQLSKKGRSSSKRN